MVFLCGGWLYWYVAVLEIGTGGRDLLLLLLVCGSREGLLLKYYIFLVVEGEALGFTRCVGLWDGVVRSLI